MVIYNFYRNKNHSGIGVYDSLDEAIQQAYKDNELDQATVLEIVDGDRKYHINEILDYWHSNLAKKEKKQDTDPFLAYNQKLKKNPEQKHQWP